jgi:hypothetical protein
MATNGNEQLVKDILGWEEQYFQKGQKVIYEGKDAQIIKVKPFLVIKTGDRVVCGALHKNLHV